MCPKSNNKWEWAARRDDFFNILIDGDISFLEESLKQYPGIENRSRWPEIKNIVSALSSKIVFCREIIKKYPAIQWINPAAVVVPRPPGHFMGRVDTSWPETLKFASWLPTHRDGRKQSRLIRAFFTVNFTPGVNRENHLSACIRKQIEFGHDKGCFIATFDSTNVQVVGCHKKETAACYEKKFPGAHYKELFDLSHDTSDEILFLPNRTLSRISTANSMYSSHMVGCYLGVRGRNCTSGGCLPEDLRALCDHFSELMYIAARDKANEELYKALTDQSRGLDKYRQMFDLLSTPLRSLTEALAQTQADTQELRAILYEPMDALIESRPLIAALFDETKMITVNNKKIKIQHQPLGYSDFSEASLVLALALTRFRGNTKKRGFSISLKEEIETYQKMNTEKANSLHEVAKLLPKILGVENWYVLKQINEDQNKEKIIRILDALKERFFTLYKPGQATTEIMWAQLAGYISVLEIQVKFKFSLEGENMVKDVDDNFILNNDSYIFAKGANPLSTQGHLIEFVAGVINQHNVANNSVNINAEISLYDCPKGTGKYGKILYGAAKKIECVFTTNSERWIKKDGEEKLKSIIEKELHNRENRLRNIAEHGDFHRPFVKFISRLTDDCVDKMDFEFKDYISLCVGDKFIVSFKNNKFMLKSEKF